jgi:hypothetical protein
MNTQSKLIKLKDPNFVEFLYQISGRRSDNNFSRDIIITPYYGTYDKPAGLAITVQGSPPKATVFLPFGSHKALILSSPNKSIDGNTKYYQLIEFLRDHDIPEEIGVGIS